jgi:hypothetical protein
MAALPAPSSAEVAPSLPAAFAGKRSMKKYLGDRGVDHPVE